MVSFMVVQTFSRGDITFLSSTASDQKTNVMLAISLKTNYNLKFYMQKDMEGALFYL